MIIHCGVFTLLKLNLIRCLFPILAIFLLTILTACSLTNTMSRLESFCNKNVGLHQRVIILPFNSGIKELKNYASNLGKSIEYNLAQQNIIEVINCNNYNKIVDFPYTLNEITQLQIFGRELGATIALAGTIADISVEYQHKGLYGFRKNIAFLTLEAQLNLINLETGIITNQKNFKHKFQLDDIQVEHIMNNAFTNSKQIIDRLQSELIEDITHWAINEISSVTWTGQILEIDNSNRIKISGGHKIGLAVGNILSVYSLGERIKLNSGQEIAISGPIIGELQLVDVGIYTSWAEPIKNKNFKNIFQLTQTVCLR